MPLAPINLEISDLPLPVRAVEFLADSQQRIDRFLADPDNPKVPAYASSNFHVAWRVLNTIAATYPKISTFCEWGSGFGVVSCLASILNFEVTGIEINEALVKAARELAAPHDLNPKFAHGSFIPPGLYLETPDMDALEKTLNFHPGDFDLIYAYPWPAEEAAVFSVFEDFAREDSMLITFHGGARVQVWNKA